MENDDKEAKNSLIYLATIIVIIVVYLIIYLFGLVINKSILAENDENYHNAVPKQPVNDIIAIQKNNNSNNNQNNNSNGNNNNQNNNTSTNNDDIVFIYEYDDGNYIDIDNQFPTKDEVGMSFVGDKYTQDFKIKVSSKALGYKYIITLTKDSESTLEEKWTKVYLSSDNVGISNCFRSNGKVKTFNEYAKHLNNANEKVLYETVVNNNDVQKGYRDFTLRMWVSEDLVVNNEAYTKRSFKAKITVYAKEI